MDEEELASCSNCGQEMYFDQDMCDECEEEEQAEQDYEDVKEMADSVIRYMKDEIRGQPEYIVEMFYDEMKDRLQDF